MDGSLSASVKQHPNVCHGFAMTSSTSSIGTNSSGTLSSPGIGSGLDVNGIVSKLMAVESQPLNDLNTQEAAYQAKISAYGSVKSALSTFQTALSSLTDPTSFQSLSATVGATGVLAASAAAPAVAGNYSIEVTQLAQAQKLASSGFASTNTVVGTGTLTFDFGTFDGTTYTPNGATGSQTVTIGSGQGTLAGIRDAVNAANIGVTATIVNDGSANGNRLVFTSTNSGASNSIRVSVADADGNNTDTSGLSQLAYNPSAAVGAGKNLVQNVAAQNALLNIDGIAVSKPTNTITDAIQGVTLNLQSTNVGLTHDADGRVVDQRRRHGGARLRQCLQRSEYDARQSHCLRPDCTARLGADRRQQRALDTVAIALDHRRRAECPRRVEHGLQFAVRGRHHVSTGRHAESRHRHAGDCVGEQCGGRRSAVRFGGAVQRRSHQRDGERDSRHTGHVCSKQHPARHTGERHGFVRCRIDHYRRRQRSIGGVDRRRQFDRDACRRHLRQRRRAGGQCNPRSTAPAPLRKTVRA